MDRLKILHTADWHVCDEFLDDATKCLDFMVGEAEDQHPDLVLIAGDIYNHRQIRQETESARLAFQTVKDLAAIAPVIILSGTPSHDGYAPKLLSGINEVHPVRVASEPCSLIVHRSPSSRKTIITRTDELISSDEDYLPIAFVSCAPAFTKQHFNTSANIAESDKLIAQELGKIFAMFGLANAQAQRTIRYHPPGHTVPHILMGHWTIGGAFIHPAQAITGLDIEISREHIDMANADLVCMGHIHAQQAIGKNIFYSGSLFPTDFGEMEAKGFYFHNLELVDMAGHWQLAESKFIHTPAPLLVKVNSELLSAKNNETANIALMQSLKKILANPNMIIRHEVIVYQDMAHTIDEEMIRQTVQKNLGPRKYELIIKRLPRPNVKSARILEVERLRDKLAIRAEILNEPIAESVLEKADDLEDMEEDQLCEKVQTEVNI